MNYLSRDGGLDADLRTAREREIEQWRERDELPFPEIEEEQEDALRDTLDYPPRGFSRRTSYDWNRRITGLSGKSKTTDSLSIGPPQTATSAQKR